MNNKHQRATSNLRMLEIVARKLGSLNDEVVYLGGCTTALFTMKILLNLWFLSNRNPLT